MTQDLLGYPAFLDNAMRSVVRAALGKVAADGLPGEHHFYITFKTDFPGVAMPKALRAQYPDEITIVLQHKFWDLSVSEDSFQVSVTFSGNPANLTVPFKAMTAFADPGANVGLQFHDGADPNATADIAMDGKIPDSATDGGPTDTADGTAEDDGEQPDKDGAKVVSLQSFRRR